jgi:hypothetical protein
MQDSRMEWNRAESVEEEKTHTMQPNRTYCEDVTPPRLSIHVFAFPASVAARSGEHAA